MNDRMKEITSEFLRDRHALQAFIYSLTRDHVEAEDILQEVWIRLFDALSQKKDIEKPMAWCRGTAKNLILHHWRNKKNSKVLVDSEVLDLFEKAFEEDEDKHDIRAERQLALRTCIDKMPQHSRELLRLRYEENLSFDDIAERLEKTSSSLMMSVSRIRKSLHECINLSVNATKPGEGVA